MKEKNQEHAQKDLKTFPLLFSYGEPPNWETTLGAGHYVVKVKLIDGMPGHEPIWTLVISKWTEV